MVLVELCDFCCCSGMEFLLLSCVTNLIELFCGVRAARFLVGFVALRAMVALFWDCFGLLWVGAVGRLAV